MIDKEFFLEIIADQVSTCKKCELHRYRNNTVPGDGDINAELAVVAEGPGQAEDEQGKVLVGRAGQLFTKWMNAINIDRKDIFHLNMVKCRPPNNRNPEQKELDACRGYLDQQIDLIQPKILIVLGAVALKSLTGDSGASIMRMRGQWITYKGIDVLPTFHPAFLLRNSSAENRKHVESDLVKIQEKYQSLGA